MDCLFWFRRLLIVPGTILSLLMAKPVVEIKGKEQSSVLQSIKIEWWSDRANSANNAPYLQNIVEYVWKSPSIDRSFSSLLPGLVTQEHWWHSKYDFEKATKDQQIESPAITEQNNVTYLDYLRLNGPIMSGKSSIILDAFLAAISWGSKKPSNIFLNICDLAFPWCSVRIVANQAVGMSSVDCSILSIPVGNASSMGSIRCY